MLKQKRGFTLEQQQELGDLLLRTSKDLTDILRTLGKSYPFKSTQLEQANRLCRYIHQLRASLEDALCTEHTERASIAVYFPPCSGQDRDSRPDFVAWCCWWGAGSIFGGCPFPQTCAPFTRRFFSCDRKISGPH